ncbi:tudor domain-containing 6 [Lampris incognitus]|uniref:tudor domain-containing 6 n=1 Tax=Lampris incognitus TaxID=2546036 RepID=UPI0024B58100|nr:tudor domain-containing 6 [Lampris incognitus]
MSSTTGVPEPGSEVTVLITTFNMNPHCVLLEFWGNLRPERKGDYLSLQKAIQSPRNVFREFEGNANDQCLVQVEDTWYRSRILSRDGFNYAVFLIDKGFTCNSTTNMLAWGEKEYFHLPPEVEFCVLSNILPLSPDGKWSPMAVEFLKSLCGKSVKSLVQDVLLPNRIVLLHIPSISQQMYEVGFAKELCPDRFKDYVLRSLQSHRNAPQVIGEKQLHFMYPELPVGTVETVVITEVTNPLRVFCQLKVFSQELRKLTDQITQHYEGRLALCPACSRVLGSPCASRGSDGRWYRSVLQQVLPADNVVEVLNIDYGKKQFVQVENVRQLATEFFRLPVVTYICSLHGIIDKGVGWTAAQIEYLKSLLQYKTMIAKFEYQSLSEGVYYVTFFREGCANINNLFGTNERCLLVCENSATDDAFCRTLCGLQHPVQQESQRNGSTDTQAVQDTGRKQIREKLPIEDLPIHSSHAAVVKCVCSPSEFWIQTQKYIGEFDELMDSISDLYMNSVGHIERNLTVGLYCAAKALDGVFHRAVVSEISEDQIKVLLVDYGNTELIHKSNVRALPDKFRELPQLAFKCRLAGVKPKGESWSHNAIDFFSKAVIAKALNVHVTAKCDDFYVVELIVFSAQGERDVSKMMCRSGYAERDEVQKSVQSKMMMPSADIPLAINPSDSCTNEGRAAVFKEHMFPIGSTINVKVSYIESPNDFWCQLIQNKVHLRLLMKAMQTYYADSHFKPFMETACVARDPDNGTWYRALVIRKHVTAHADVLFVDYGQTKTVLLQDLRKISPAFLNMKGQAFRCRLYNPVDPSIMKEWNEEATARFQEFVDNAATNGIILKCTIYAVMSNSEKVVFNVVNLESPFESVCTHIVHLAKSTPPKKASGPSLHLDTYYYSTHNIKTGMEEMVTVTCVNGINKFFCQLQRNMDVMEELRTKLNALCNSLKKDRLPTTFGSMCLAKYTDGCWYRGQINAIEPSVLVHFVDYGDTLEVDMLDLLPVPRETREITAVPVQAVQCGLSDIPTCVPDEVEVNSWFETNVMDKVFKAVVVAKEPDGKLLVELYYGKTQVNSKIKEKFHIGMHRKEQDICQKRKALEDSTSHTQKAPKAVPTLAMEMKDDNASPWPAPKPVCAVDENDQRVRDPTFELYRTLHHRQSSVVKPSTMRNSPGPTTAHTNQVKQNVLTELQKPLTNQLPYKESEDKGSYDHEPKIEVFPKITELPSKPITSGMEANVFVSYCNSPLSFYVQLVNEEDDIFSIVEKLNDRQSTSETIDIKDLHPCDLVEAEFTEDSSWYRAVVRETHGTGTATVEFIDFGNTAVLSSSKIRRLDKAFLQFPSYSTHCLLSKAAAAGKDVALDPAVVSTFKENVGSNGDKELKCRFIKQSGLIWEVSLEDCDISITSKKAPRDSTAFSQKSKQEDEKSGQGFSSREAPSKVSKINALPLRYHRLCLSKGEKLAAYVTAVNGPWSFWCQSADTNELDKITEGVSEIGSAVQDIPFDTNSLFPGSPCLALFADDGEWYRAEVIGKDGEMLSVLFVDYGNESQVCTENVREIPAVLVETSPQAFLCELEGFDASLGLWNDGATDEISRLLMDKLLQLTIQRISRNEEGETKYFVKEECEGQLLNDILKAYYEASQTEIKPDTTGVLISTSSCDSTLKEEAVPLQPLPKNPENPIYREVDGSLAFIEAEKGHGEEQQACFKQHGESVVFSAIDEASALTGVAVSTEAVKNSYESNGSVQSESFADEQLEERDKNPEEALAPSMNRTQKTSEKLFPLSEAMPDSAEFITTTSDKYVDKEFKSVITKMEVHSEDLATVIEDKSDLTPEAYDPTEQEAETGVAAIQEKALSMPKHKDDEPEDVTSLTEKACSAEVCIDPMIEAELVISEQPVHTAPSQNMESSLLNLMLLTIFQDLADDVFEEGGSYYAEDGFGK